MEVYIILTDTGTVLTKIIRRFTKHPLNHASISFTKELDTTYSFGRKRVNNPFIGGFVKENLNGKLFEKAECAIYKCSVSAVEYEQMLKAVQEIEVEQQMYKYNFIGLFGVLFNKEINREGAFFCSEFVATILKNGGVATNSKPPSLMKPYDLVDGEKFLLLYEGQLRSYLVPQSQYADEMVNETKMTDQLFNLGTLFLKKAKSIVSYI